MPTNTSNQNPEQIARDHIDKQLQACGWAVQNKKQIDLGAALGVAVREYQTDAGPADYLLFVDKKPVGVIEAKEANKGFQLTHRENTPRCGVTFPPQSEGGANPRFETHILA